MPDGFTFVHRAPIIWLAARSNVPRFYWKLRHCQRRRLLSYGPDTQTYFVAPPPMSIDSPRRKPGSFPFNPRQVRAGHESRPQKALGLDVPGFSSSAADEVDRVARAGRR